MYFCVDRIEVLGKVTWMGMEIKSAGTGVYGWNFCPYYVPICDCSKQAMLGWLAEWLLRECCPRRLRTTHRRSHSDTVKWFSAAEYIHPNRQMHSCISNRWVNEYMISRHGLLKIVTMSGQCVIYQVNVRGLGYNWTTFYTLAAVTTGWGTNSAHLQLNN